jgi:hypothetical protein
MKKLALGLVAAVALTGAALAAAPADPMASRYENTVTLTDAKGAVTKVHYNKDGTMTVTQPDGAKVTGKWTLKDGKLCVTLDAGPTAGKEGCNPFADHKVGDTWDVTLADGTKSKAALVAGR